MPAVKAIPDRKNNALTRCTVLQAISALTCVRHRQLRVAALSANRNGMLTAYACAIAVCRA